MLSIKECQKILNKNGKEYSDDEIAKIRSWIYNLAEITVDYLQGKKANDCLEIERRIKIKNKGKNDNQ